MRTSSPLVEQIHQGIASRSVKQFAAQGVVPLPEADLIPLQIFLSGDFDAEIADIARSSLATVPEATWIRLVEQKDPDPDIVDFCLEQKQFSPLVREKVLLNHSVPDELICRFASSQSGPLLDLVITNHVRLLREPKILQALELNPLLSIDQKRRIEEFKTEFVFKKAQHALAEETREEFSYSLDDILARIPNLDAEAQRILKEAENAPRVELSDEEVQQTLHSVFTEEELSQIPEEVLSTYQKILRMSQGDKLRAALFGTREERTILIRDGSRTVASMVLRNPKLIDPEIEMYAQMRNLSSDLLRQMGQSREFLKRYTVIHNLVKNPKTPTPIALNLLKLLREADLKNLQRDRNIPDVIRRQARRVVEQKAGNR